MYLDFYGFEREPFHITPDPDFLFLSPSHKEAFATVVYGVEQRKGFVALTGEVGTGKTTILRAYLKRIDKTPTRPIYLFNPDLTFEELLRLILRETGADDLEGPAAAMLDRLQWLLIDEYKAGQNVALIIDEAQNMPIETLEKLRMLSNLETAKDKLLQIVLVGQPELDRKLELHALRQLRQRVAVRAVIRPLTRGESYEYVRYRLTQAGCLRESVFAKDALRRMVTSARGNPRLLNILCDNALIAGFGAMEQTVSGKIVRQVIADLSGGARRRRLGWAVAAGTVCMAVAAFTVGLAFASRTEGAPRAAVAEVRETVTPAPVTAQAEMAVPVEPAPVPTPKSLDHRLVAMKKMEETFAGAPAAVEASREKEAQAEVSLEEDSVKLEEDSLKAALRTTADSLETEARGGLKAGIETAPEGGLKAALPTALDTAATESSKIERRVGRGDCLTRLVAEVYGRSTPALLEAVRRENPQVANVDIIWFGDTLVFPERIVDEQGVVHSVAIPAASVGE
ncbi:MAG TPA: AAA family ATPase [Candidatus Hydrogenedentes bacterium]|nr:AAA family ATPase [Candidatus Hydrogenedentota bacterium]HNT87489.1 AAA family ATPase [Candidatus Hydrogenedentota bacterium]